MGAADDVTSATLTSGAGGSMIAAGFLTVAFFFAIVARVASVIGGQIAIQDETSCVHLPSLIYLSSLSVPGFKKSVFICI